MKAVKTIRLAWLVVGACVLFVWISAVITLGIVNLAQYADTPFGTYLMDKGGERIMRRVLLAGAVAVGILLLKKFGWRGWQDCGWTRDTAGLPRRGGINFLQGVVLGFITLGSMAAATIVLGLHNFKPMQAAPAHLAGLVLLFAASGLSVALVEETICRGMMFRVFARAWNLWTAALVISVVFAAAHFAGPAQAAFHGDSFIAITLNITAATFASFLPPPSEIIRFVNLALLGLVLCAFVMRTQTIWMSVGAHAAWVFTIKLHSHFTALNPAAAAASWLGKRNDFMDSPAVIPLFAVLIFGALWKNGQTGSPAQIHGQTWRILPAASGKLEAFFRAGEELFSGGRTLKSYPGCRVASKDGLVLKKYRPKNFMNGLRFAFKRARSRRAFLLAQRLAAAGLPTPPVLAWSASRRFGLLMSEAMIVSEVQNAEPLTDWLNQKTGDRATRAKVMAAYGVLMADFHRHNYSNRDFKHENVMCSRENPWMLCAVDLDGVRKLPFITRRRTGRDLMRVGNSLASLGWTDKTEVDSFFAAYNNRVPPRLRRHAFPGNT
ncbi:MAG: lipopolysaccharide kinase InaA family protein [Kiritimatiellae bacterium]|nr:lipopolysaccharide kinase InaA family protein [Kiritimatiellia bacterium]